jgi:hypothetical protein
MTTPDALIFVADEKAVADFIETWTGTVDDPELRGCHWKLSYDELHKFLALLADRDRRLGEVEKLADHLRDSDPEHVAIRRRLRAILSGGGDGK